MKAPAFSKGFTLAEVLITLGIIGVVAAMTIPTVLQNMRDQSTVSALKKAQSTLSQAFLQAIKDNGTPDLWDIPAGTVGSENLLNILATYLNVTNKCGDTSGCFPPEKYKQLNGTDESGVPMDSPNGYAKAVLADGTLLSVTSYGDCSWSAADDNLLLQNECGELHVDINGFKKPNQYGIDMFIFYIGKNGIAPIGTKAESGAGWDEFTDACQDKTTANGYGCAAWVIYNQNLDYLKCNNLSWDGPTQCN